MTQPQSGILPSEFLTKNHKTVLVTGANRGLGLEFARQYAKEGWAVIASYRDPNRAQSLMELQKEFPQAIYLCQLDTSNEEELHNLSKKLSDISIDVLINNAGKYGPSGNNLSNTNPKEWLEIFLTNSIAPLLVTRAFMEQVQKSQQKKIIMISSSMGSIADNTSGGAYIYRSSKTALNSVTKSLAIDLNDKGITVVALHPGWVKTDMGGPNALIEAKDSIFNLRKLIDSLTLKDSGQFFDYKGMALLW
jgi:NAD(P)-dependent dehydrogenase (short-subunit alcohol dehydrogenase family)